MGEVMVQNFDPTAKMHPYPAYSTTPTFRERIIAMNYRYALPVSSAPDLANLGEKASTRLTKFRTVLQNELDEIEQVILMAEAHESGNNYADPDTGKSYPVDEADVMTALLDLLGDLIVYETSEATKFGLPVEEGLGIIMDSNDSKLGEDGKPMKDSNGKFVKGPNYWKPEPLLKNLIVNKIEEAYCNFDEPGPAQ